MTINLAPIMPLVDAGITNELRKDFGPRGPDQLLVGYLGTMRWMVTLDSDGECEASLSCERGRPTQAQVAAFFARWGRPIPAEDPLSIGKGRGLHWVIAEGTQQ